MQCNMPWTINDNGIFNVIPDIDILNVLFEMLHKMYGLSTSWRAVTQQ